MAAALFGWGVLVGIGGASPWRAAVAVTAITVLVLAGLALAASFATPPPPPPDAGVLRKVRLTYRCSICGTEVRMTTATNEDPEPPRHCQDDMDLVTPVDDL